MSQFVSPALLGEIVVLLLLIGVVWMVFKELTRMALKILIPAGILMGIAVWLGVLDETVAGSILTALGEGVISGIRVVASWVTSASVSG